VVVETDGYGYGHGDGYGYGYGYGDGSGDGDGSGYGYGYGYGDGSGYGYGYGSGSGSGSGHGDGDGYGYGYGSGDGSGHGDGEVYVPHDRPWSAWHILPKDGRLRYEHRGERKVVSVGLVLEWPEPDIEICARGLHASLSEKDARKYCDGFVVTKVACSGRIIVQHDKFVCSRRKVIEVFSS